MLVFGCNRNNELGLLADELDKKTLCNIPSPTLNPHLDNVQDIKIGLKHTVFIINDTSLNKALFYASGSNAKGALATGDNSFDPTCLLQDLTDKWKLPDIYQLEASWNNTIILTSLPQG